MKGELTPLGVFVFGLLFICIFLVIPITLTMHSIEVGSIRMHECINYCDNNNIEYVTYDILPKNWDIIECYCSDSADNVIKKLVLVNWND